MPTRALATWYEPDGQCLPNRMGTNRVTYRVRLIGNDQLPEDYDWAMVHHGDNYTFFVKNEGLTPRALEDAWEAYRMLSQQPAMASR